MKTKTGVSLAGIVILSATFFAAGMYETTRYREVADREARFRGVQQELARIDALEDDGAAVAACKKLPALPEVQARITQRQWHLALELWNYMQRSGRNAELQNQTGASGARLKILLDEVVERCGATLADAASLRPDVVWRLHNAAGAAKVLSALVMLESEQNADKVQGVMRDALTDFKASIEAVDKAGVSPLYKNVPRWNFEVLNGEENVQKFQVSLTDMEKNQALKENLETMIPEIGGYAPGEPVETRVKK